MAIVTFWSDSRKDTAQTSTALAIATHMAMEKNMRILLVDANFCDESITRAYWKKQKESRFLRELNSGKIDISAGADGLVSAIASNKASPEIIANFTKGVFRNRLDVLPGLRTKSPTEFDKSLVYYKDLLLNANKFYDIVLVDLAKTSEKPTVRALLDISSIVMYTMTPDLMLIDSYIESLKNYAFLQKNNVIPILGRSDELSKYNPSNVAKKLGLRNGMAFIPYNIRFAEATYEGEISKYLINLKNGSKDENQQLFTDGINDSIERILYKIQELQIR
ncbi:MAG: hypothetical protein J6J60_04820 [Clostridia bacterium]|nr:hypothetical protein [Clostridia bacterium]